MTASVALIESKMFLIRGPEWKFLRSQIVALNETPAEREHLGLTQAEVARRLGISQSAYAQQEAKEPARKSTREKIAQALGIAAEQLAV